jgi:hypothetical protein
MERCAIILARCGSLKYNFLVENIRFSEALSERGNFGKSYIMFNLKIKTIRNERNYSEKQERKS